MINDILVFVYPGLWEGIILFIAFFACLGVPALLIILFVVCVVKSSKERQKLRLELSRLADELEQTRKQIQAGKKDNSSGGSG